MLNSSEKAKLLIEKLNLKEHPEGGYYSEIYRSEGLIPALALSETHSSFRHFMTSIYFMLKPGQVSRFHRLKSDEIWYYHSGSSLTIHQIMADGTYNKLLLGPDLLAGQSFQVVVLAGCWFGATVASESEISLAGCAVAPGFDFQDFELADQKQLLQEFPQHEEIISVLST